MRTILHISDLHFGVKHGVESFLPEVGERLLKAAERVQPDVLVVSGDLTIRAEPEELQAARTYLDRFQVPHRLIVPGNHDARGERGLAKFVEHVGPTEPTLHLPELVVVGVDSTEEDAESEEKDRSSIHAWEKAQRMSKGFVGPEQFPRIRRELEAATEGMLKVVVLHHHLVGIPGVGIDTDPLIDSGDVLKLLVGQGAHLVLAGHKHRPWLWNLNGLLILHAGTAVSRRYKQGITENSVNVVRFAEGRLSLEHLSLATEKTTLLWEGPLSPPTPPRT